MCLQMCCQMCPDTRAEARAMTLTDARLLTLTTSGKRADGQGLYLEASPTAGQRGG